MDSENDNDFKRPTTACFTGHRELPHHLVDKICAATGNAVENLIVRGYDTFVAGGARGYDALAAETVLDIARKHPSIRLIIVLPFPDHYQRDEYNWAPEDIRQYHRLQKMASCVIHVSRAYVRGAFKMRDRYMVDMSSACIAYMTDPKSGTGYTVGYAQSQGLSVIDVASMLGQLLG